MSIPATRDPSAGEASSPSRHHVVIIGSGFGGLFAAREFKNKNVDVTLIAKTGHHLFQPLLYQVATGILSVGEIAPPTRFILRDLKNVKIVLGDVSDIDVTSKKVKYVSGRLDIETAGHVLHLFRRDVDVGDISEHDLHILEVPENETRRRSDLADRQDARGHLIEKRLEEVMAGLCDERDIDVLVLELAGREKPTEPGSDDHDVVPRRGTRFSGGGVARGGYGHSSLLGSQ